MRNDGKNERVCKVSKSKPRTGNSMRMSWSRIFKYLLKKKERQNQDPQSERGSKMRAPVRLLSHPVPSLASRLSSWLVILCLTSTHTAERRGCNRPSFCWPNIRAFDRVSRIYDGGGIYLFSRNVLHLEIIKFCYFRANWIFLLSRSPQPLAFQSFL